MQIRPTAFTIGLIIYSFIALFFVYTEFGIDSFSLLMDLFVGHAVEYLTISEQVISAFVDKFLEAIPDALKIKLMAA